MPSTIGIVASAYFEASFSPLDLPSLAGWWDADDASTFTYSSGTLVSQWDDRSGNGYHLVQSTGASQPSRSGTINSRSSVVFDGSNDFFTVANFDMTGGQKFSVAVVATAATGNFRIFMEHGAASTTGGFAFYRESSPGATPGVTLGKTGSGVSTFYTNSRSLVSSPPRIAVGTHDGTLSTNENTVWVDGVAVGTRPVNQNTNSNGINATLYVGARGGTSLFQSGDIAEMVVTKAVLTTTERQDLETYLANKWGITL
jgi:hypothetical protein